MNDCRMSLGVFSASPCPWRGFCAAGAAVFGLFSGRLVVSPAAVRGRLPASPEGAWISSVPNVVDAPSVRPSQSPEEGPLLAFVGGVGLETDSIEGLTFFKKGKITYMLLGLLFRRRVWRSTKCYNIYHVTGFLSLFDLPPPPHETSRSKIREYPLPRLVA